VVREYYARRFEHILVDEFQDTNLAQYSLLKNLASIHNNLFVVGDEDQSIYRWRGADYHNVLRFEHDYPSHEKVLLEQNYRSPQTILDVARSVIDRNHNRTPKRLFTERGEGERISLHEATDDHAEAEYVVQTISSEVNSKRSSFADFAVMYRTNAQSRLMEEAFLHAGIPYRLVGAQRFYGRREVKDCIAYLRLIHNPHDSNSLERIINVPLRGIGDKTILSLREYAASLNTPPTNILLDLVKGEGSPHWRQFGGGAARKLADFGSRLEEWLSLKESLPLPKLFARILEDIDYRSYIEDESEEGADRWENVEELMRVAFDHETTGLTTFLETIALVADQDTLPDRPDAPTLLTLHASKGLEFPVVFITGLDEKLLPHSRSMDDEEEMAEERRLFYVGITRTKDRLFLTRAESRGMYGGYDFTEPCRFLADIPEKLIKTSRPRQNQQTTFWRTGNRTSQASNDGYGSSIVWNTGITPQAVKPAVEQKYSASMRVMHPSWGEGLVLESKLLDREEIVVVEFDSVGLKRLDAALANLTIVEKH
jgi:DNA helicase-2/ATP-dependent DNA helicase PcrA